MIELMEAFGEAYNMLKKMEGAQWNNRVRECSITFEPENAKDPHLCGDNNAPSQALKVARQNPQIHEQGKKTNVVIFKTSLHTL